MKKILVVDDDPGIVELLRIRLENNGYQVTTANNGAVGLQKAQELKPDLILLDIGMPQIDGCTFVREIKKMDEVNKIPIIVLTGKDYLQNYLFEEGIEAYLIKPVIIKEMLGKLKSILGE